MLCIVVAGTMLSKVDKNIVLWINFLTVDKTVEHSYNVVTRRHQRITRSRIFRAKETLDVFF